MPAGGTESAKDEIVVLVRNSGEIFDAPGVSTMAAPYLGKNVIPHLFRHGIPKGLRQRRKGKALWWFPIDVHAGHGHHIVRLRVAKQRASKAASAASAPSSVNVTDLFRPRGCAISPALCSRFSASQSKDFQACQADASPSRCAVSHKAASTI